MIEIKGLKKKFQNEESLCYKDYCFEDNKSYILLGASGCGKSTLLNMIAGILASSEGEVIIDGKDMTKASLYEKDSYRIKEIGYIFQDFKLIEEMSVNDNIDILKLEGIDTSNAEKYIDDLGLKGLENKKINQLSGGQKQRVAIIRALVKSPSIILADEPTGNLNFEVGEQVVKELLKASEGKTLIAVSHDDRLCKYFDVTLDMNTFITRKA